MSGLSGRPAATIPLAHPLAHGADAGAERPWATISLVVALALLCAAYGRGVHELWHRRGTGAVVPRWRAGAFATGVAAVLTALTGPVHERAEHDFAGHMAQHMILLTVAGPLLAAGTVGLPLALAAPRRMRGRWARWRCTPLGRSLRRPGKAVVLIGAAHAAVLWAWHLPALYRLALHSELVHAVEHASFVGAAMLLWSVVLGARQHRLPGPVAIVLLFATMLAASALGAALTLAPAPVYPPDLLAPHGGDPLTDQQLAGLLMWIPMDVLVLTAALAVLLRWLARLDRAAPAGHGLLPGDAATDRHPASATVRPGGTIR